MKNIDDIVTRLRESSGMTTSRSDDGFLSIHPDTDLMRQAADEIERLRAELDSYKSSSKRLSNGPIPNKPSLKTKQTNGGAW